MLLVMDSWTTKTSISIVVVIVLGILIRLYNALVKEPNNIREMLRKQGINGPKPKIVLGNVLEIMKAQKTTFKALVNHSHPPISHNTESVFPFLEQWRKKYGPLFMFSIGKLQVIYANNTDLVKAITTSTSIDLGTPSHLHKLFGPLLGQGILTSNGAVWEIQRKIMAPELFMDNVKGMMKIITESAVNLINSLKNEVDETEDGVLDTSVDGYMKRFSGDVLSRTCFSSNYSKGQELFTKLGALQDILAKLVFEIPGQRYLPTRSNRKMWALEKEVCALILTVVKERQQTGYKNDLLQMLLEGAINSDLNDQFIVDNCRNIYLAGFHAPATVASWCLMLLASNPEWQTRLRDEVSQVCQGQIPDMDMLRKLKLLNMVIQETLRLYPPAPILVREAFKDMKIGDLNVLKGVNLCIMPSVLHTNTEIWGLDALKFNPQRFENGIVGACKNPNAYIPFGFGQRVCIGQNLAIFELKILVALVVLNFSLELSPKYVHSPVMKMILEPKHGVHLLISKI